MENQIRKGKWREFKGQIREEWGRISDDELEKTKGNMDQIAGKIQQKYGETLKDAKIKLNRFADKFNEKLS